jgi:acetylglutamate kinase
MVKGPERAGGSSRTVARSARVVKPIGPNAYDFARGPFVVKLGGKALRGPQAMGELAAALRAMDRPAVLVHGGGPEVTQWCTRLGLETRFDDGLRVTFGETRDVAVAVLAGLTNKRIVAALQAHGVGAFGLSALDGGLARVKPHSRTAQLGAVGEVTGIHAQAVQHVLDAGFTPVISSIGAADGELLNVNADDLATALAVNVRASALLLLSDTPGLRLSGTLQTQLTSDAIEAALAGRDVTDGMRPKLRAVVLALEGGVPRAHVAAWDGPDTLMRLLSATPPGTTFMPGDTAAPAGEVAHA